MITIIITATTTTTTFRCSSNNMYETASRPFLQSSGETDKMTNGSKMVEKDRIVVICYKLSPFQHYYERKEKKFTN